MNIVKYLNSILEVLQNNKDKLNQLDAAIGDGDHGTNVVRGFEAVLSQQAQFTDSSTIDKDLMLIAQKLMSTIGGSSGPLLGSAFMACAISLKGKTSFSNADLGNAFKAAADRIGQLGKSHTGEATMLDALVPAAEAMINTHGNLSFKDASIAANKGAEATIPMLATKGRASYLGERSIGHMDPGAYSVALIFKALDDAGVGVTHNTNTVSRVEQTTAKDLVGSAAQAKLQPVSKLVNILVVSHSEALAKATIHFVSEMKNGDFKLECVAGIEGGKAFGTDPQVIKSTIERLTQDAELLIIYDLGSSKMNTDMAYSQLTPEVQARVQICSCAFLEGTLIATISNTSNSALSLKEVVESQVKVEK